ncbi:hypothetical protein VUJ46_21750 [Chryseobacterium sp. MYb264]|uniref:XAC2610-related protein n=1 Tax=Chryseobacterium sp. MYb264 TaxID=2745153 RepID=UPI002E0F896E|nr:hypothetical protein VUJ46_21750 [Chryseobacterium sp. MYb264]
MTYFKFLLPLLLAGTSVFAQYKIELKNISPNYQAKISMEDCSGDECRGEATIELINNATKKVQNFTSGNFTFYIKDQPAPVKGQLSTVTFDALMESPVIIDDFNFDGTEDVAIRNGSLGNYGAPSYDVYVYNMTQKKFVPSKELTELASNYLGFFEVDPERKRLIVYGKSGAAFHYTAEYAVVPGKGLLRVFEVEEDASGGEKVKVTKKELINHKWIKTVKNYPIEEYYK